jgi:hypothetical protein
MFIGVDTDQNETISTPNSNSAEQSSSNPLRPDSFKVVDR